jgi:hypothetical protein
MGRYAQHTRVPVERTKAQIEHELERYGADGFTSGWQGKQEAIGFLVGGLRIQISVERPDDDQERRQRWRALLLVVKAKLEAVDSGISTIEQEFLAWVVCGNGQTIGQALLPQLESISHGDMPKLLEAS